MRKAAIIGLVLTFLVGAGITVTWFGAVDERLALVPVAIAQDATTETPVAPSPDRAITDSGQAAVKNAIASVGPAVVRVDVTGTVEVAHPFSELYDDPFFRRFFGAPEDESYQQETQSVGSGFVIQFDDEKLVITNEHVIFNAETITVSNMEGDEWSAQVIGRDDVLDIAVLRLEGDTETLHVVPLGDSDAVELGDWAIAIGSPLGLSHTATLGIVSAIERTIQKPSGIGIYENLIQTDAAINPGNSGGPLVNAYGEVIGINTMIARRTSGGVFVQGINFAIAINSVTDVLSRLVQEGEVARGWLGIQHTDVTEETAQEFGVDPETPGALIVGVFPGDPADLGGLRSGDVMIRFNESEIRNSDDLMDAIRGLTAGTEVEITVIREDDVLTKSVTLGRRPADRDLLDYRGSAPAEPVTAALGLTVGPITDIIARHLGLNSTEGVVIMGIESGSRAENAGLVEGDVILEINHQSVDSVDAWESKIAALEDTDGITVTVYRAGRLHFYTL
jgi:serine protease Do